MDFLIWLVEWMRPAALYIQLSFDTGWMAQQLQTMPFIMQTIHDRLEAWINDDKDK